MLARADPTRKRWGTTPRPPSSAIALPWVAAGAGVTVDGDPAGGLSAAGAAGADPEAPGLDGHGGGAGGVERPSIGTRAGVDQVVPSVEVLNTMSLTAQPVRKRQSCQATYTVPSAATSADGSGPVRRPPATGWASAVATVVVALQLAP